MQFTRSSEENEDQKATSNLGDTSETIQVHRTTGTIQEVIIPGRLPTRAETQQYGRGCRCRVLSIRCGRPRREWAQPRALREPREKSQPLAILRRRKRRDDRRVCSSDILWICTRVFE